MAHSEQTVYINETKDSEKYKKFFGHGGVSNLKVLDVGCHDINGNNKIYFNWDNVAEYVGCDVFDGAGVDIVCPGHELKFEDGYFDTIISCECFEHDMHYPKTFKNIVRMLKPGGAFVFTCATTGRQEHGTRKAHEWCTPIANNNDFPEEWQDYYKNLTEGDIREVIDVDGIFGEYRFSDTLKTGGSEDLQFRGIKVANGDLA